MILLSSDSRYALYEQASSQIANGLTLLEVLEKFKERLSQRTRRKYVKDTEAITEIEAAVRNGGQFAQALGPHVPYAERQIVASGEVVGGKGIGEAMGLVLMVREMTSEIRGAFFAALLAPMGYVISLWACLAVIGVQVTPEFLPIVSLAKWGFWGKLMYYMGEMASSWVGVVLGAALIGLVIWAFWARDNWTGRGRVFCDRWLFPFTLFRDIDGFVLVMTYSALLRSGMSDTGALVTLIDGSSPYVRHRLAPIPVRMKNGIDLAGAFRAAKFGFPSEDLVDEIGAYAGFADFPVKLEAVGRSFAKKLVKRLAFKVAVLGLVFGGLTFFVMGAVQLGSNNIQSAIMSSVGQRF